MFHPIKEFRSFVATLERLCTSLDVLAAEQKELRTKFDTLVEHSGYLATAKKNELRRAGHHS